MGLRKYLVHFGFCGVWIIVCFLQSVLGVLGLFTRFLILLLCLRCAVCMGEGGGGRGRWERAGEVGEGGGGGRGWKRVGEGGRGGRGRERVGENGRRMCMSKGRKGLCTEVGRGLGMRKGGWVVHRGWERLCMREGRVEEGG